MIDRPLADITADDLQRLVINRVSEMRSLEYKQALPGNADADKKEFLADVSSFANAVGGDLLYGVTGRLLAGDTPVPLTSAKLTCVHLVPHVALAGATDVDLSILDNRADLQRPFYSEGGWGTRRPLMFAPRGVGNRSRAPTT